MSLDEFVSSYENIRKRYKKLPSFNEIDNELEISNFIMEKGFVPAFMLRVVRRTMMNVLFSWNNYLQMFLIPNPSSLVSMQDSSSLSDDERASITEIVSRLTILIKENYLCELEKDEKSEADFIAKCFSEWLKIKQQLTKLTETNIAFWRKSKPEYV